MQPLASNFTVSDLIGITAAFLLFPLFTLVPGYVCGWLLDAFGFRQRTLLARVAISVPMSIGISPIVAYLSWHWSILATWAVFGVMWLGFLGLLVHERQLWLLRLALSKQRVAFIGIVIGWIVLGTCLLIDLQFKDRLYFSFLAHDYTMRAAITSSITRSGIPPHNPYFFPGQPVFLRYHYFWFILCSLVEQIGRSFLSSRQAMLAGTLWSGIGLMAVIPLYLRFFQPKGSLNLDRRILIAVALLGITGLDILPIALLDVINRTVLPTVEMWNNPIVAWAGEILWAPHQVAALVACLTGFLLIWHRRRVPGRSGDILASLGAGAMFASALGLSVYVTLVFAAFLAVWVIVDCARREYREAGLICAAGFVALTLCVPYLLELLGKSAGQSASGGPFLQLTVRLFFIVDLVVSELEPARPWLIPLVNTFVLPLNYLLELGFFFLIASEQWRSMRATRNFFRHPELCGFVMAAVSVVICTFLRSGVIAINDLGMRGFMIAQFVFLIWGAELLDEGLLSRSLNMAGARPDLIRSYRSARILLIATMLLGMAGTLYELCVVRFYPLLADDTSMQMSPWLTSDRKLGKRTFALRELYEGLKTKLQQNAVVQQNPNTDPGDLFYGLYADRQAGAETMACGTVLGGDPASCDRIIGPIDALFEKPQGIDATQVSAVCKKLSIDALIVKDTDPAWADKTSWVWRAQASLANGYGRAFVCKEMGQSSVPLTAWRRAGEPPRAAKPAKRWARAALAPGTVKPLED